MKIAAMKMAFILFRHGLTILFAGCICTLLIFMCVNARYLK